MTKNNYIELVWNILEPVIKDKNTTGFLIDSNIDTKTLMNIIASVGEELKQDFPLNIAVYSAIHDEIVKENIDFAKFYSQGKFTFSPMALFTINKTDHDLTKELKTRWANETLYESLPSDCEIIIGPDNFDWSEYYVFIFKDQYKQKIVSYFNKYAVKNNIKFVANLD